MLDSTSNTSLKTKYKPTECEWNCLRPYTADGQF